MTKHLHMYVNLPEGGHLDVATVRLTNYTLVLDDELAKLRAAASGLPDDQWSSTDVLHVLDLCRHALTTPDGRTLTKKASAAVSEINKMLTWKHR